MARAVLVALVNGNQTRSKASTTHHQKERQNRGVLSSATVDHSGPFTQLLSDRLVLYKAFAPVFLQSCVPVYVRVHTGVGGDVGNHVHSQYLLRLFLSPRSPPLLCSSAGAAEAEAEAERLAAQEVAEERERALKARLAAIEAREAQTRVVRGNARGSSLPRRKHGMVRLNGACNCKQVQPEQADAINVTEAERVGPIAQLRGRSQKKTDFILAQALEQQHIAEKEMRKRGREEAERQS